MMLVASQGLLWLAVIALAIIVIALTRQIGVLHERITPVGALALAQGPQPGEDAPRVTAAALSGMAVEIGGPARDQRFRLLFFVSPSCPVCKQLLPTAQRFAKAEAVDLLFVGDGDIDSHMRMAAQHSIALASFINDPIVGHSYRVGKLPYAVLIDPAGKIAAQGLVNTREHLESLLAPGETGFASVQDYLAHRNGHAGAHHHKAGPHD